MRLFHCISNKHALDVMAAQRLKVSLFHRKTSLGGIRMTLPGMRTSCFVLLLVLMSFLSAIQSWGESCFIRVPLQQGVSVEVPKNWILLSESHRMTIETVMEARGKQPLSPLAFGANLLDGDTTIASVNTQFYPNEKRTQDELQLLTSRDLKKIDLTVEQAAKESSKDFGVRVTKCFHSRKKVINGIYTFIIEYLHTGVGDQGLMRIRSVRVWNGARSFAVTFTYRERQAMILLPIIDYMTNSIRQD